MTYIKLIPSDTFFFRNHRDLETGKGTFLKGVFPPRLSTVYGALRSAYIYSHSDFEAYVAEQHEDVKHWMGSPNEVGQFQIRGLFMHDGEEAILPLPLDHQVIVENDEQEIAVPLLLKFDSTPSSNGQNYQLLGPKEEKSASAEQGYVKASAWKATLLERQPLPIYRQSEWIERQSKVGIKLHRHERTVIDGMLYNVEMLQFKAKYPNASIVIDLKEAPNYEAVKTAKFGGFGRPWGVQQVEESILHFSDQEKQQIINQIKGNGVARIVFLTSAIWENGMRPSNFNPATNTFKFNEVEVQFLAMATHRPIVIGGWDMVRNRPKPRKSALPAGTVVYVRVLPEDAEQFVETLLLNQWTDEAAHEGYGLVACGAAKISGERGEL